MPVIILEGKSGNSVYGFPGDSMGSYEAKDMAASAMTELIRQNKPDCACFVSTAWTVEGLSELDAEMYKSGSIKLSEHPKRIEIVHAYCYGERGPNEGEALMFGYIQRYPDKGPRIKKWKIHNDYDACMGRFPEAIKEGFKQARGG